MTEAASLRAFVAEALRDGGAEVREEGDALWINAPGSLQRDLEIPAMHSLVFDPERAGEFGAELVAPGSYFLERILSRATSRGRWDCGRYQVSGEAWPLDALRESGVPFNPGDWIVAESREGCLGIFTFRVVLESDEKRESYHAIAVPLPSDDGWEIQATVSERELLPVPVPSEGLALEPAYRVASRVLEERVRGRVEAFRKASLAALEEEVRRIFAYFDGTVREVQAAGSPVARGLIRATEAERDRRLTEALERFEPRATAVLCAVRIVETPFARLMPPKSGPGSGTITVDAFTRTVRLREGITGAGSARLPAGPPLDTPRRRTRAGPAAGRSPRGSTARSRSASERRRSP